ncbi:conserved hypothetical protein [Vibrio jasicida]|uniref:Uncharacterized protein n=1 Tax=Vibrio jasicida TaxID=766224 RepID=A0AAU9QRV6_9VIBR|nr:hypothetical protein [Vibrio coralliilyticus]PAW00743.1 hypothetical protein CKJ79_25160 [Vibrio coralliilyticus]CAH1587529.1 conserved hypothetical protein [Vibrio jasicida]CAH1600097.1 conserved hypothetical protein [Vibrio jasicida]
MDQVVADIQDFKPLTLSVVLGMWLFPKERNGASLLKFQAEDIINTTERIRFDEKCREMQPKLKSLLLEFERSYGRPSSTRLNTAEKVAEYNARFKDCFSCYISVSVNDKEKTASITF